MAMALRIGWDLRRAQVAFLSALVAAALLSAATPRVVDAGLPESVIVRELPGAGDVPERAVASLGGSVVRQIELIHGFVARVPRHRLDALRTAWGVAAVTPDAAIELQHAVDGYNPADDAGSWFHTAKSVKADMAWSSGLTGAGVDVALIDSGVVPVNGLAAPGKIVNGPDLSFESQAEHLRYLDTFGHGTHMAGLIAGRDDGATPSQGNHDDFMGIAPGARILNVKVANAMGAADVSQVIAAIDWVVQHKNDAGMNIRVLNLSFGTDGVQDYVLDPLTYAVEVAWRNGIVVVVAAGNAGFGNAKLNNPAYDPFVIAVGSSDTRGTYNTDDDVVPDWSSRGDGTRNPDLVAPGKSVVSLRSPNSYADQNYPGGRVGSRFFRGSGTSQSAAVVSGAAALVIQQRPGITPDQVKKLLMDTASPMPVADPIAQGEGVLDLKVATRTATPAYAQTWPAATGLGSLEGARGSGHIVDETGAELRGEIDIFGHPWDAQSWSRQSWSRQSWSGGLWMGQVWAGDSWTTDAWNRQSWSGVSWERQSWSRQSWSRQSWSRQSWSRQSWSGEAWSGQAWSADSWSRQSWSRQSWSSAAWGGEPIRLSAPAPAASAEPTAEPTAEPSSEPLPVDETTPSPEPSADEGSGEEAVPPGDPEPSPEVSTAPEEEG